MIIRRMIAYFKSKPKYIFLFDAIGALISVAWIFLLVTLYPIKNVQVNKIVKVLFVIAISFALYSSFCYFFVIRKRSQFLLGIMIANTVYALLTATVVLAHYQYLNRVVVLYFIIEIFVLLFVVYLETKVWKGIHRKF